MEEMNVFQLPGPNYELQRRFCLVDDDFAEILDCAFYEETRILVITDCCHSGTLADVDTHDWGDRRICSFAACQDHEQSTDTGRGGVLSKAIEYAVRELAFTKGKKEYSLYQIWKRILRYARRLEIDQLPVMTYANIDPKRSAWPMPQAWWKNLPGTVGFKVQLEIEQLRRDHASKEYGLRALQKWEEVALM